MKRTLPILLLACLCSFAAAQGRVLDNGPIKIQLNKDPAILIKAAPKEAEMDKNHAEIHGKPGDAVLTDEQVSFLANKIAVVRKLLYETAAALRNKNPNMKYNTYMASTYLKHWPLEEVERDYMLHVAMCPAAVLKQDIDKSTTQFQVSPYSWVSNSITEPYWKEVNVEKQSLISGTTGNDLIPICASTTDSQYSEDGHSFIFFIRLGNELMRVEDWNAAKGKIRVIRGFNDSVISTHARGAIVTSPVYNKGCTPGSEKGKLAYCSDKGPNNLPILERKGREMLELMTNEDVAERYDGSELDAMTGGLPQFGMVNALSNKTVPWDFINNRPYSVYDWVTGHDRMMGVIQKTVHDAIGRWPVLQANGISPSHFEEIGETKRLLMPTDLKPRSLDSYNTEAGFSVGGKQFKNIFHMFQTSFQNNLTPCFSFKAAHYADSQKLYDECMIYTFAFFYLVYEPKPEGWDVEKDGAGIQIGCSYFSPWFNMPSVGPEWIHPGSKRSYKCGLPYALFLPLGKPADEDKPKKYEDLLYKDTELLSRKYENGLVILNPTSSKGKWKFEGNDAEISDHGPGNGFENPKTYNFELDQKYIDVETGDYIEGIITLPPRSGKILLIEPSL